MKPLYRSLTVAALAATLVACNDDDVNADVVTVAEREGGFTTLVGALRATGLDAVLEDKTRDFTVFAPTDAAFEALGDISGLTTEQLTDILLYHVIPDAEIEAADAIAAAGTTVTTANTDDVGIRLSGADLFINQSQVVSADVEAGNGVIHAIDTVLIPTTDDVASGTIAAVATANGSFTSLLAALGRTGLDALFIDEAGKYTVFAPTDAAFTAAGIDVNTVDEDVLENILLYHVVAGAEINASAATAVAGNTISMANADNMALSLSGTELFANLSSIVIPNVDASNGIIHAIDTVLTPPADPATPTQNIVEIAQADPATFSTLVTLLGSTSDLVGVLSGDGPFTVFAPTNAAFTALEAANPGITATLTGDADGILRDTLMKHVVPGAVDSVTAFTFNGVPVGTANEDGETVTPAIDSGVLTVNGAQVTVTDVQATNGIIHVIDAVITLDP